MSSALPHQQNISGTSGTEGAQVFAGTNLGTVNYSNNPDDPLKDLFAAAAVDAPFYAQKRQNDPVCLPDTRAELLKDISKWVDGQNERCVFWLRGWAGTGKSTIARTVASTYHEKQRLGASFFFSRGSGDLGHAGKFVTTIALQLVSSIPALRKHVCDVLRAHGDITNRSSAEQWKKLILGPLSMLDKDSSKGAYVLVVDALDECENEEDVQLVQLLAQVRSLGSVRLRIFLTSRPESTIRYEFDGVPEQARQQYILQNIPSVIADHDIRIFLSHNFQVMAKKGYVDSDWPREDVMRTLVDVASGLFIWAATTCRYVGEGKQFAPTRLEKILRKTRDLAMAPEKHLDDIYITVLGTSISPDFDEEEKEEICFILRLVLGSIVTLYSQLSMYSLSKLLRLERRDIERTLDDLHSILDVPEDETRPLRLHHPSFRDFLLSSRCNDSKFRVYEQQTHQTLADKCIRLMSEGQKLKQDVCEVKIPGVLVSEIERSRVNQSLPPEVQYACLYWVQHVQKANIQLQDNDQVHQFLQKHLLHWLEALGWMGRISEGIQAVILLESITTASDCPDLSAFVDDSKRLVLYSRAAIEQAPLQIYCSALMFSPAGSMIRERFKRCESQWIETSPITENKWDALLQTLEGHSGVVSAVAFSHDSTLLASASSDCTVRICDARTGWWQRTLEGHDDSVNAVAFSHDSTLLASGSDDDTVRIWDARTGECQPTLVGHFNNVNAVAFSNDSTLLASGSDDRTVQIWDPRTGECQRTLEGHGGGVNAVVFSHDSTLLASASDDYTVRIWDPRTGEWQGTFEGHRDNVQAVAFSHDSTLVASASWDSTVRIWDARTGEYQSILNDPGDEVNAVAFSHDSTLLASASDNCTVRIWDARTGECQRTLEGHDDSVNAVAFSNDSTLLASGSDDRTVRIWDARIGERERTLEAHGDKVRAVAFSHDSTLLASGSDDVTVRVWGARTGEYQRTLEGHFSSVNVVAFSNDSTLLASGSDDRTVRIWDARTGECQRTFEGHSSRVNAVAFSRDSTLLASASDEVRIWDMRTGECQRILEARSSEVVAVAFSHDSTLLASAWFVARVKIWDARTGECQRTIRARGAAVAFSPDSTILALASDDGTVQIWDARTGEWQRSLNVGKGLSNISFDATGFILLTEIGGVALDTPSHSVATTEGAIAEKAALPPEYRGGGLTADGVWVTFNSQRWVWLPPEYRPEQSAVSGRTIAVGVASGKVWLCTIAISH